METKRAAHPQACYGVILRKLASAGVRPTRQRLDVARAIFGAGNRHFTAEMIYQETRSIRFAPTLGTIYNTLNEFARCGLLREIAIYDAKLWYDTKTGPHFHFYREDTEELSDIPEEWLPEFEDRSPRRHGDRGDRRDRAAEEALARRAPSSCSCAIPSPPTDPRRLIFTALAARLQAAALLSAAIVSIGLEIAVASRIELGRFAG